MDGWFRRGAFVLAILLQLCGVMVYLFGTTNPSMVTVRVGRLMTGLLPASLALSVVLRFSHSSRVRLSVLGARFVVMLVMAYGVGPNILVPLLFVLSMICEFVVYLYFWVAVSASLVVIAVIAFSRDNVSVWNVVLAGPSLGETIAFLAITVAFAVIGLGCRRFYESAIRCRSSISHLDRTVDALTSANVGFQRYAIDAEHRAAEAERNRIVRELHDSIGYTLTNVVVMSRVAERIAPIEHMELRELLGTIRNQAQSGLTEMRSTLRILRAGRPNRPRGMAAIQQLAVTFQRSTGVEINVEFTNVSWDPDSPLDAAIFRIVQEALTNAFRHGRARHVLVHFFQDATGLFLNIEDDGNGAESEGVGLGLSGMQERVRGLRGTFSISTTRFGFSVRIWLPREHLRGGT